MGLAQLAGDVGGYEGSVVVSGLLLHLLRLGDARGLGRLGLSGGKVHRVKVTLVGTGKASVLTGGLLPSEAWAHGSILHGNLGRLGRCVGILGRPRLLRLGLDGFGARHVLGDKLLVWKIVVSCDASQETGGVLLKGRGEDGAEGVHL